MIAILAALLTIGALPAQDGEAPTAARCEITSGGGNYSGPCQFEADDNGTFLLTLADGKPFWGDLASLGVNIESPGAANLVLATTDGHSNSGGALKRSTTDTACWVGDAISICVY